METARQIAAWVTPAMHARVKALAADRGVAVSCVIAELVENAIDESRTLPSPMPTPKQVASDRITVRLRPGDVSAVVRRAKARRMKPATYIAALVRSHLVEDPPLPTAELAVLERAAAEVSAIGRNLNQIARAINSGVAVAPATASIIGQSVEAVEAVRQAAKDYVRTAVASWEAPLG